jgi:hypothetical protein
MCDFKKCNRLSRKRTVLLKKWYYKATVYPAYGIEDIVKDTGARTWRQRVYDNFVQRRLQIILLFSLLLF